MPNRRGASLARVDAEPAGRVAVVMRGGRVEHDVMPAAAAVFVEIGTVVLRT
jgi:hypothetical protein